MSNPNPESYPPLFRPTQEPDPDEGPSPMDKDPDPNPDSLPLIDMECLDVEELERACRDWGIFRLVNHGVPTRLISQLQEHAKSIFDMDFETKQGLIGPGLEGKCPLSLRYFWGTPALTQGGVVLPRASGGVQNVDWVEGFNVPLLQLSSSSLRHHHHPLVLAFSNLLEDYGGHLTKLASKLFEAMMRSLKHDYLHQSGTCLDESMGLIRVYRYPHHNNKVEHVNGMHVHTDSSVLSILNEDEVGGLHFLKDEKWLDVKPIPTTLVVNLGDMMQALSDDEYKSVKHKVTLNKHKERVSICYFVFPEENSLIQSSKYKPFTYNDFRAQVQLDIKTLGSKVGLERFRKMSNTLT